MLKFWRFCLLLLSLSIMACSVSGGGAHYVKPRYTDGCGMPVSVSYEK